MKRLADELIASLERELDYGAEAASGEAFLEHLDDDAGIAAPHVYQALSTRRVLVMEEIDGLTVADHDAVAASPVTTSVLATRLLRSFLEQVLRDGLYHADPHPGNIFVDRQGTLWFLDFGAVGRLNPVILESMQEMAIGFQLNDPVVLARALQRLAGGDESSDSRALEADIGLVLTRGPRQRELRPEGDEHDARHHGSPRPRGADADDRPVPGAAHARRDAAHDRPDVQHRPRGHRVDPCPR